MSGICSVFRLQDGKMRLPAMCFAQIRPVTGKGAGPNIRRFGGPATGP